MNKPELSKAVRGNPNLKTAEYAGDYRISVSFEDGAAGIIDLKDELRGKVFEPLKDISKFRAFQLDLELQTIVWPTGADIAPESLYRRVTGQGDLQ